MKSRVVFAVVLAFALCFSLAPAQAQPNVTGTLTDAIGTDTDADTEVDRGDTIKYEMTVGNSGAANANGVQVNGTLDANTTLVPGSLKVGPIALDDADNVNLTGNVEVDVLANDRDGDAGSLDPATVTVVGAPAQGSTAVNTTTGAITYTSTGTAGADTFTYTVEDDDGILSRQATVTVDVNSCPTANDDAVSTDEETVGTGDVLADNSNGADSDPESDTLTVTEVNGVGANVGSQIALASGALLTVNSNGSYSYDPNGVFNSLGSAASDSDTFTYTIGDGNVGCSDTATVTMTINGVNDCPPPRMTISAPTKTRCLPAT